MCTPVLAESIVSYSVAVITVGVAVFVVVGMVCFACVLWKESRGLH